MGLGVIGSCFTACASFSDDGRVDERISVKDQASSSRLLIVVSSPGLGADVEIRPLRCIFLSQRISCARGEPSASPHAGCYLVDLAGLTVGSQQAECSADAGKTSLQSGPRSVYTTRLSNDTDNHPLRAGLRYHTFSGILFNFLTVSFELLQRGPFAERCLSARLFSGFRHVAKA